MTTPLLLAVALMLVLEGAMPFISPAAWRETIRRLTQFSDGQIRFAGTDIAPLTPREIQALGVTHIADEISHTGGIINLLHFKLF